MIEKFRAVFYSLLLVGISGTSVQAQAPFAKWGKVSEEDLALKVYENDPKAEALVLADQGEISFVLVDGIQYRFYRHRRIKILKEAGFDQANIAIVYHSGGNEERLSNLKAQIFSPDGEKQTLSKKVILTEEVDENWSLKKFSFPEVAVGSIIEYRYEITSRRISKLRDWYFQENIPVRYSELQLEVPKWFDYVYLFQGVENKIKWEKEDGSIAMESKSGGSLLEGDAKVQLEKSRIIMEDVPALRAEPYITTMEDYCARLRFYLRRIQYPNGDVAKFLHNWDDLAKELQEHLFFGQQYGNMESCKELSEAAAEQFDKEASPQEQINQLYYFLNRRVKWNGEYSPYVRSSLDSAFIKGQANSGELNLMLLALLREFTNITAYPMLLSTRTHGKMLKQYPIIDQFNHVLVQVELEEESLLLDIGDELRPPGFPRIESLNSYGWLVKDEPEWSRVEAAKGSDVLTVLADLSADGSISGSIEGSYRGYQAINERQAFMDNSAQSQWLNRLAEKFPAAKIDSIGFEARGKENVPFKMRIRFSIPGAAKIEGKRMYLNPILYSLFDESHVMLAQRTFPVDIPYPFKEQFVLLLHLPEGFRVEQMPQSARAVLPGNGAEFNYILNQKEHSLQLVSKMHFRQINYQPEEFTDLQIFLDTSREKLNEQVVLIKEDQE